MCINVNNNVFFFKYRNHIFVKIDWLVASIAQKQPADKRNYLYTVDIINKSANDDLSAIPSPASKKNIQSMTHSFRKPQHLPQRRLNFNGDDDDNGKNDEDILLNKYSQGLDEQDAKRISEPPNSSANNKSNKQDDSEANLIGCSVSESDTDIINCFVGTTICFHGFYLNENYQNMLDGTKAGGAKHVDIEYNDQVDYLIVPTDILSMDNVTMKALHTVNEHYVVSEFLFGII